jgi:hypothetical protein
MPHPVRLAETGETTILRCARCGAPVDGTCHTRVGYTVGHYALHTGRTEEATLRRGSEEAPLVYRRLLEPVDVVSCAGCFATAEMRRLWAAFGDPEEPSPS